MQQIIIRLLSFALLLLTVAPAEAQEWNQWRGAGRNGVASNFSVPASWSNTLKQVWKTPVGEGYSSPVIAESRIYLHTRRDEQEVVSCVDLKTGKIIWSQNYPAPYT